MGYAKVDCLFGLRQSQEGVSLWSLLLKCLPTNCEASAAQDSLIGIGRSGVNGSRVSLLNSATSAGCRYMGIIHGIISSLCGQVAVTGFITSGLHIGLAIVAAVMGAFRLSFPLSLGMTTSLTSGSCGNAERTAAFKSRRKVSG